MKYSISVIALALLVLVSCKKEKAKEPTPANTTGATSFKFATDVQPIFVQHCGTNGSCHGANSGADGKIYVVIAVISVVLAGMFFYLFKLDKKITDVEQQVEDVAEQTRL